MDQIACKDIRPYQDADRDAVFALASRLAVGIAPWRSTEGMITAARGWIEAAISGIGENQAIFVAEATSGVVLGFVSVARQTEFTGETQAYIGELAMDAAVEGQGIGQMLLAAVEAWAVERSLALLVLDTGAANTRARNFYYRNGFEDESVRLTKQLGVRPDPIRLG